MTGFINLILFYGFFLGVTLAIGNLAVKKKNKKSNFYTVSIFMMGILLLNVALYSTRIIINYEWICTALLPVSYFAAVNQYIRYDKLVSAKDAGNKNKFIYYIPAFGVIIILLIPAVSPGISYNRELLRFNPIISGEFQKLSWYYKTVMLLYPLLFFYHVSLFCMPLIRTAFIWKKKYSDQKLVLSKASYSCASFICLASLVIGTGSLLSFNIIKFGLFLGNNSMLLTFIFSMRYPEFRINLYEEVEKYGYIKSKIKSLNVRDIINRLEDAMSNHRAYAMQGITIKTMADKLNITVHQLSEILNSHIGMNFNTYINGYRIDEAKRLLLKRQDMTIIEVSGEVGFNSSSSFSTIFSKREGISPRDFRKKN